MFTTDSNLALLWESTRVCGNGTFKASPALWSQLYTLHGAMNGYTVHCEDVVIACEDLADSFEDDELPVLAYFESTWIGSIIGRRGRRSLPQFVEDMATVLHAQTTR